MRTALMGSNMQRQAVPLLRPEAPLVSAGIERQAAVDSGQVNAQHPVKLLWRQATRWSCSKMMARSGFIGFANTSANQSTCIDQRPVVQKGDRSTRIG